jgi:hypothetical protein
MMGIINTNMICKQWAPSVVSKMSSKSHFFTLWSVSYKIFHKKVKYVIIYRRSITQGITNDKKTIMGRGCGSDEIENSWIEASS